MGAETTEALRAAIETALRRRDGYGGVIVGTRDYRTAKDRWSATSAVAVGRVEVWCESEADALRALAVACGLREDGSDPAEEVRRLRERVDILSARHEAGLEDRDRLRNERDEAKRASDADLLSLPPPDPRRRDAWQLYLVARERLEAARAALDALTREP